MIFICNVTNRPMFFLDGDIQGIMPGNWEHAKKVAMDVCGETDPARVYVAEAEYLKKVG